MHAVGKIILAVLLLCLLIHHTEAGWMSGLGKAAKKAKNTIGKIAKKGFKKMKSLAKDGLKKAADKLKEVAEETLKEQATAFLSKENMGNMLCAPQGEEGGVLGGGLCNTIGLANKNDPNFPTKDKPGMGYDDEGKAMVQIGSQPLNNLVNYMYDRENEKARKAQQAEMRRRAALPRIPPNPMQRCLFTEYNPTYPDSDVRKSTVAKSGTGRSWAFKEGYLGTILTLDNCMNPRAPFFYFQISVSDEQLGTNVKLRPKYDNRYGCKAEIVIKDYKLKCISFRNYKHELCHTISLETLKEVNRRFERLTFLIETAITGQSGTSKCVYVKPKLMSKSGKDIGFSQDQIDAFIKSPREFVGCTKWGLIAGGLSVAFTIVLLELLMPDFKIYIFVKPDDSDAIVPKKKHIKIKIRAHRKRHGKKGGKKGGKKEDKKHGKGHDKKTTENEKPDRKSSKKAHKHREHGGKSNKDKDKSPDKEKKRKR